MGRKAVKIQDIKPNIIYALSSDCVDLSYMFMFCNNDGFANMKYLDGVRGRMSEGTVYLVRELTSLEKELV